jgi:hypothetical protein
MQPFRAALIDEGGATIANVEGSIQSEAEAPGARTGAFELPENESFLQDTLERKPFRLALDDGSRMNIEVTSVSAGSRPGTSRAEFAST